MSESENIYDGLPVLLRLTVLFTLTIWIGNDSIFSKEDIQKVFSDIEFDELDVRDNVITIITKKLFSTVAKS